MVNYSQACASDMHSLCQMLGQIFCYDVKYQNICLLNEAKHEGGLLI